MIRFYEARPRKGFTLTEVLMAMFVMAIGMISLLALFPAAFQQAKWALDNEQVARAAGNAQSMTEMPHMAVTQLPVAGSVPIVSSTSQSVRDDDRYRPELSNGNMMWNVSPAVTFTGQLGRQFFLVDTTNKTWTYSPDINIALPGTRVKFPPVFVDPVNADPTISIFIDPISSIPFLVGASNPPAAMLPFAAVGGSWTTVDTATLRPKISLGIPRSSMSQYVRDPGTGTRLRMQNEISMGDEINFDTNGQPMVSGGSQFARQRRFTWAYMCNWPDYANPSVCEVTAIMFNTRPDNGGLSTMPPGEVTLGGNNIAANAAGTDSTVLGRVFVKGLTQATIFIGSTLQPINLKVGDWILDSTLILPEYNDAFPTEKAPFLDTYNPTFMYGFPAVAPVRFLRPGLVGGHFYKVMDVSEPRLAPGAGFFQTVTLDRPAKSDGFSVTIISGIADVITKSVGRMPQR